MYIDVVIDKGKIERDRERRCVKVKSLLVVRTVQGCLGSGARSQLSELLDTALERQVFRTNQGLMDMLDRLEVLYSLCVRVIEIQVRTAHLDVQQSWSYLDVQFQGRILITHDQTLRMHLNSRYGPHVVHTAFDTVGQSNGLYSTLFV